MLARIADVWVVTRENNQRAIEAALPQVPEREHLRFVYVDLPERLRFWKRGHRRARLYYLIWQAMMVREARRIDSEVGFDVVWHLTMSTVWLGSLAPLLRKPFVFGPVGGGVGTPWRLVAALGAKGTVHDVGRAAARSVARYANPLARLAWRRARLILVQNPNTRDWLPGRVRSRVEVFPHIVLEEATWTQISPARPSRLQHHGRVAMYAGRLLPWKGVSLAIRAVALLPEWQLLVCGDGPDEARLRDIALNAGVTDRVTFLGSLPRDDLLRLMREQTDLFLFPSLHDEGGWVIAEALACDLPVVCLNWGGPAVLAGQGVAVGAVGSTIAALAKAVEAAVADATQRRRPPMFEETSRRLSELVETKVLVCLPRENDDLTSG
jgi:glycosyltransferase involved in cell wall biosynthesis